MSFKAGFCLKGRLCYEVLLRSRVATLDRMPNFTTTDVLFLCNGNAPEPHPKPISSVGISQADPRRVNFIN